MPRRAVLAAAAAALAVAGGGVAAGVLLTRDGDGLPAGALAGPGAVRVTGERADRRYVIPAGTGQRLSAGEKLNLLPGRITARVGDVITIVNDDDRGYLLGPFYVGPRETLSQRFTSPGVFTGSCVVHPSGELQLVVTA